MHSFRLATSVKTIGVLEPVAINPDIAEPVKFSDLKIVGESDPKLHGFLYGYSQEGISLEFTCESAHALISQQYYQFGSDLDVRFQIIYTDDDTGDEEIDDEFVLKGDSIVIEPGKVKATLEKKSIHQLVDSRFDTPIAMDSWKTLDGKALTPPSWLELRLPGQAIKQAEESNRVKKEDFSESIPNPPPALLFFITPNTQEVPVEAGQEKPQVESIKALVRGMGGVTSYVNPENAGDGTSFPFLKPDTGGTFALVFDWVFTVDASLTRKALDFIGAPRFARWILRTVMVTVTAAGTRTEVAIAPEQRGSGEKTHLGRRTVEARINQTLTLEKGDKVYIYAAFFVVPSEPVKSITVNVTALQVHVKLTTLTKADPSITKMWLLPDAIRHVLRCITNQSNLDTPAIDPLISELLDSGPASEYAVTNGASLRGVPKAPTFSLKQLMGLLSAFHVAGLQYKGNQVQIEAGDWFYQDVEITRVNQVFDYREEVASEHLYNQVEVGYNKYPDSGPGVREEFNTTRTYQTPLLNFGQKLEIKSPLIGAGTAIEQVRTVQFLEEPTTSHAYDDDGFVLHVQNAIYTNLVRFQTIDAAPFPGVPYSRRVATFFFTNAILRAGSAITFLTGVGTGMTILITNVIRKSIILGTQVEFLTNDAIPNTSGYEPVTFQAGNEPAKIRNDERLLITGLSDPSSVVNAELSPARILRRHAPFLLNGLRYKPLSAEMKCTFFSQNGEMSSQVRPESNALPGDPYKQTVYESGPLAVGEMEKLGRLFSPEWIYFTGTMEREELKLLLAALEDSEDAPEEKRRGYLAVVDPDGVVKTGWLRMGGSIQYNPCSEVVEIKMLKRFADPTIVDCDLYRDKTYTDFEQDPTIDQNLYLFCQFLEFQ
jgi:hypothetical protein